MVLCITAADTHIPVWSAGSSASDPALATVPAKQRITAEGLELLPPPVGDLDVPGSWFQSGPFPTVTRAIWIVNQQIGYPFYTSLSLFLAVPTPTALVCLSSPL